MKAGGGRADRRRARQAKVDKDRGAAREFVDEHLREAGAIEGHWASAMHGRQHDKLVEEILNKVVYAGWPQGKILAGLTHLARRSREIIAHHKLDIAPFQAPYLSNRLDDYRSEKSFHKGVAAREWERAFNSVLTNSRSMDRDSFEHWMGLALVSAIFRGGLLQPWQVAALHESMHRSDRWLSAGAFDRPVMHFQSEVRSGHYNCGSFKAPILEWHFVPDAMTLALLSRAWNHQTRPPASTESLSEDMKAYQAITSALFGVKQRKDFTTLAQLCSACAWLVESRRGVAMPRALIDIATGKQPSVPLERKCHDHLWRQPGPGRSTLTPPIDGKPASLSRAPEWDEMQRRFLDMTRESLQLYTEDRRKVSPKVAVQALLTQSTHFEVGSIEHLITVWLEYRINRDSASLADSDWKDLSGQRKRAIKLVSALRYHHWISVPLVDRLAGRNLFEQRLSIEDFEDIYEDILDSEPDPGEQKQIAGRLADFHNFAAEHPAYKFPRLRDALLDRTRSVRRVRARTLPVDHYRAVRRALHEGVDDPLAADLLELVVVLAYRLGLRIGEIVKLRLGDVEQSDDLVLLIRENRYGSNKSPAALRKLAAGLVLDDDEVKLLRSVVRRAKGGNKGAPLISSGGMPWARAALSASVNRVLREVTGDSGWTFHHLRHSAANNALLTLMDASAMAEKVAGWDDEQQRRVKLAILREPLPWQHRLNSLAAFLGHAGPDQTIESYFHLAPELIGERMGKAEISAESQVLYGAALNLPPSRLAECQSDKDILQRFQPRWKKLTEKPEKTRSSRTRRQKPGQPVRRAALPPIRQCLLFLDEMEKGTTIEEAADLAQIPLDQASRWLDSAQDIAGLETRQGNKRFFSKKRVEAFKNDRERVELLAPGKPTHHLKESKAFVELLWTLSGRREREVDWWLDFVLNHYSASTGRIRFRELVDLTRFMKLLDGSPFSPARWEINLDVPEEHAEKWRSAAKRLGLNVSADHGAATEATRTRTRTRTRSKTKARIKARTKTVTARGGWAKGHAELFLRETETTGKPIGERARVLAAGYLGYSLHLLGVILEWQLPTVARGQQVNKDQLQCKVAAGSE